MSLGCLELFIGMIYWDLLLFIDLFIGICWFIEHPVPAVSTGGAARSWMGAKGRKRGQQLHSSILAVI